MRGNSLSHILWSFRPSFSPCPSGIVVVVFHFDSGGRKAKKTLPHPYLRLEGAATRVRQVEDFVQELCRGARTERVANATCVVWGGQLGVAFSFSFPRCHIAYCLPKVARVRRGYVLLSPRLFCNALQRRMRAWWGNAETMPSCCERRDDMPSLLDARFADDIVFLARPAAPAMIVFQERVREW